jgi:hypothetical protein
MNNTSHCSWTSPLQPSLLAPDENSRMEDVALFLHEAQADHGNLSERDVIGFCRHHQLLVREWQVDKLLDRMDEMAGQSRRKRLGGVSYSRWEWAALQGELPGYVLRCPRRLWHMNRKTGHSFSFFAPCNSFKCLPKCAPKRIESELIWACRKLPKEERIWVAHFPHSKENLERVRKRRERAGRGGSVAVHRDDTDRIYLFSNKDLSGPRGVPTTGRWMDPQEALDLLGSLLLELPGVGSVRWLGTWSRPPDSPKNPRTFHLGEAPRDLAEAAIAEAERNLSEEFGPNALEGFSEDEIEAVWLPMVEEAIEEQWNLWKQRDD